MDLWCHLRKQNSAALPNLKLETVAQHFLGRGKHDLPPQRLFDEYERGPEGRATVARYCLQDCALVLDLVERLNVVPSLLEMSRVAATLPEDINFKGQQIKVYSQLLRAAHAENYVVEDAGGGDEEGDESYEGATVIEPVVGYYGDAVLTVDFASLYPSLMQTYNLSPETLLPPDAAPDDGFSVRPPNSERRFLRGAVRRGLLPRLLTELLAERQRAKRAAASEQDPLRRALLDAKQLALKVSANSIYGACGARRGLLSCVDVARATTGAGRHLILFTREHIERRFPGSAVVYGDTDSCFVRPAEAAARGSGEELFALGEAMAASVTAAFAEEVPGSVVRLEVEKFLRPLILYKKKRYAGLCFEEPGKPGKLLFRGIELVRRDAIPLVRDVQREVLHELLAGRGPEAAAAAVRAAVERVLTLEGGADLACVTYSKTLKASYAGGGESLAHVRAAQLMERRAEGSAPRVGERVEYVVVASETARVVDKVEAVEHARRLRLPIDWSHYVQALAAPMSRLLDVPLRSLGPHVFDAMRGFFLAAADRAQRQVRERSLARHGEEWLFGHVSKGGGTQLKLGFGSRSAAPPPKRRRPAESEEDPRQRKLAFG